MSVALRSSHTRRAMVGSGPWEGSGTWKRTGKEAGERREDRSQIHVILNSGKVGHETGVGEERMA